MGSDVWVGDLLRALASQPEADDATQQAIARLLGFDFMPAGADRGSRGAGEATPTGVDETSTGAPRREPGPDTAPPPRRSEPVVQATGGDDGAPTLLVPSGYDPFPPRQWSAPSLPPPDRSRRTARLPHESLLAPRSASSVLHRALSRKVDEGELDIPAIIGRLSRGLPVGRLPRRPVRTLRFGVQMLVDLGTGMEPFSRDAQQVVQQVRATAGHEHTEVVYFDHSPMRSAGPGPRWTWGDYPPPAPGTRVFILSDLGMGGPRLDPRRSTRAEWEHLVRLLKHSQCTAVAFVPFPKSRWPAWATKLLPLAPWDRQTTAGWAAAHLD